MPVQVVSSISEINGNTAPQTISWDYDNQCLNVNMHTDSVNLSVGEEEYFPIVVNKTAATITNGTLVGFGGVDGGVEVVPYLADGSFQPWYIAGIATQDIFVNGTGRISKFGYVHGVDTTGGAEAWAAGDILYASPTVAGAMTKVKPTAPNLVIPVAVVRTVSATVGVLLVRILPQQRLYYGVFSDASTQTVPVINTVYAFKYSSTDIASGFSVTSDGTADTRITAANAGLYNFQFSVQLAASSASAADLFIWPRIGTPGGSETDVTNSCSKWTIKSASDVYVLAWNFVLSLSAGQYFRLMYAATGTNLSFPYVAGISSPYVRPAIPSIILSVTQANQ